MDDGGLIAQLQDQGFSLAGIRRLTEAWESGRGPDDVLGLETQAAAVWAPEQPTRLTLGEFLARQAPCLDSAGAGDQLRPLARAAGLDL